MKIEEEKINSWFLKELEKKKYVKKNQVVDPPTNRIRIIIEVDDHVNEVVNDLRRIGVKVYTNLISFDRFIPAEATIDQIPEIQQIPHVIKIHYDMPRYIYYKDPLLGIVTVSKVEIPCSKKEIFQSRIKALLKCLKRGKLDFTRPGYKIIPSSFVTSMFGIEDNIVENVKVAVLDSGCPSFHPLLGMKNIVLKTTIPEPPQDFLGHGTWVTATGFGSSFLTRFGLCKSVADVKNILHVKVLNSLGFGTTASVLKGIDIACKWDADVISMSLGGPIQGSIEEDPECSVLLEVGKKRIVCCAAGNKGPNLWTIGSPAACPEVITVASLSFPETDKPSFFSSRGPQASWYKERNDEFEKGMKKYKEDFIKPDVAAVGGGRPSIKLRPMTVIYSAVVGWFDGYYDLIINGFDAMMGTSQATPQIAGYLAILLEKKKIKSARDFKRKMKKNEKRIDIGYGFPEVIV